MIVSLRSLYRRRFKGVSQHKIHLHLAALLFFLLLAFIVLYAQVFHHRTQGAGYDYFFPHWCFWWTQHALTTEGLNVYQSNFVMFPFETNYAYNALTLFWYPTWALLEPVVGTLTAVTLIIWLACALNGYLLFVWLLSEKVSPGLALIGGAALQLFPIARYFYYNTHINLMDWFWLPLHLLLWKQIVNAAKTRRIKRALGWAVIQGIALWGLVLTDLQFPIFLVFVLVPYVLLTLWLIPNRQMLIAAGLLVGAVALILLWFAGPLPYILRFDGKLVPSPVEERPVIPFPDGFIAMSHQWWDWNSPSLGGFIPLVTVLSIIAVLLKSPRFHYEKWFWFLVLLPPFILAIGPTLQIGHVHIPLPFRLLYEATKGMFRMPWRLAPVFVIAAMMFAGKAWSPLLPRSAATRTWLLAGVFLLLVCDIRLYEAGPLRPIVTPYSFYKVMEREPYQYTVVEVPTGAGTGEVLLGDSDAIAFQYYGITHGKRMVNGFISRAPIEHFWYLYLDDPMLSWLGQRRPLEPKQVRAQLADRIYHWPIGYIVVHMDYIRRKQVDPLEVTGHLNSLTDLLCAPVVEGNALFYRTRWHPEGCDPRIPPETEPGVYTIDIGTSGDERYLGWGWYPPELAAGLTLRWTGAQPQAQMVVELPPGEYEISLSMQSFWEARRVHLLVNNIPLNSEVTVSSEGLAVYTFRLPGGIVEEHQPFVLALEYDKSLVPAEIGQSSDQRNLSVWVDWIQFRKVNRQGFEKE